MRNHLGSFGIKGALATHPMRSLSGGQAVRVGLAVVAFASPHLLVLVSNLSPHPLPHPFIPTPTPIPFVPVWRSRDHETPVHFAPCTPALALPHNAASMQWSGLILCL